MQTRRFFWALALLISFFSANSQTPALKFNANKKFKIVQFTDVHYIHGDSRADGVLQNIGKIVDAEKPDLVFFTGDVIFGKPAEESMRAVLYIISSRNIPFAVTFGNHDDEHELSREKLLDIIQTIPHNLTTTTPGISGVTNFILPVQSSNSTKPAYILYSFDSHAYSTIKDIGGYDYIKFDQIDWYRKNSTAYTQQNGGNPIPSLAFFHIPLPEYNQAASDENAILTGTRKEKACAPQLNSGLFTAMKELNDVKGMFVGHDHDNDYAIYWKDILLAYGRYSGGNTVYNNLNPSGARVIELTEGADSFRTWIHLQGDVIIHDIQVPGFFLKKKE
jgi:3',5'-cyclic AMP phosphodiesterase CpdA